MRSLYLNCYTHVRDLPIKSVQKVVKKLKFTLLQSAQSRSPSNARSHVKGVHSSGEIELIHVGFPT
jgi:hypothetical protein